MRDRLIELLKKADKNTSDKGITDYADAIADNADYLLANGVIVPPCKVGDTVWSFLENNRLLECEVKQIFVDKKEIGMAYEPKSFRGRMYGVNIRAFGKTVFLTREEAEAKLKGEQ